MLASLFVRFFGPSGAGDGAARKVPRYLISTRKLRKVYDRLVKGPKAKPAMAAAAQFIETVPFEPSEVAAEPRPNFALMARDAETVERLMSLLKEMEEEEALMLMMALV